MLTNEKLKQIVSSIKNATLIEHKTEPKIVLVSGRRKAFLYIKEENNLDVEIMGRDGKPITTYDATYDDDEEFETQISVAADLLDTAEEEAEEFIEDIAEDEDIADLTTDYNVGDPEENKDKIIVEEDSDYSSVPAGIEDLKPFAVKLGDKLKALVDQASNPEMKAAINDLALNAYNLSVNMDEVLTDYKELAGIEEEPGINDDIE